MHKKILAGAMVIGILALAMGLGTYSYFSDTGYSKDNTFSSGTLDIKLWGTDNVTATWTSPANWKPGDGVNSTLRVRDYGNIGCYYIYFGISGLTGDIGDHSFADNIFVESLAHAVHVHAQLHGSPKVAFHI